MPLHLYVAYWEGKPAAWAALSLERVLPGLHEVHTLRHMQRNGIGRGLVSHVHDQARNVGSRMAVAVSCEEGLNLYASLGFEGHRVMDVYLHTYDQTGRLDRVRIYSQPDEAVLERAADGLETP